MTKDKTISIITPAYNEQTNLGLFYERLLQAISGKDYCVEWIIIDDHSSDETFAEIARLAQECDWIKGIRLAKNSGSHKAVHCGLKLCSGSCAVVLAADLQDPPEKIPELVAEWENGSKVVWAVRAKREGEKKSGLYFSRLYYWIMRNLAGMKEMPSTGADFFLIDKVVINGLMQFPELNTSIFALICWMGFQQKSILYDKQSRQHGSSGWTLRKKLRLVVDSITCFSVFPLRFLSGIGIAMSILGLGYSLFIIINSLNGAPVQGWASLMVVVLFIGGFQMLMLGVLGEYLWRNLEETRRRPRYLIENQVGIDCEIEIN